MITRDNLDRVLGSIGRLTRRECLVGIPADRAGRDPEPGERDPPNNAVIGYAMEFGLPDQNVPARPFLVPGVEDARDRIAEQLRVGAARAASVDAPSSGEAVADRALEAAGIVAAASVQERLTEGPFAPLAESTILARARRGRRGARRYLRERRRIAALAAGEQAAALADLDAQSLVRPLIDTGQLRASITYVVRG